MAVKGSGLGGREAIDPPSTKRKRASPKRKPKPATSSQQRTPKADPASKAKTKAKARTKAKKKPVEPAPKALTDAKPLVGGRKALYERVTPEQLKGICDLLKTGRASLDDAVRVNICASGSSIGRAQEAGMQALLKMEEGLELDEREQKAYVWYEAVDQALSHGAVLLTRQAAGDRNIVIAIDEEGNKVYANGDPKYAPMAMAILRLTRKHWRPAIETEISVKGTLSSLTDEELFAKEAALRAAIGADTP